MESIPSASYSVTLRIEFPHEAGSLGRTLTTVGDAGGMVGAVDIVRMGEKRSTRDITVNARDSEHGERVVKAVEELPGVRVVNVSDRTFKGLQPHHQAQHRGGRLRRHRCPGARRHRTESRDAGYGGQGRHGAQARLRSHSQGQLHRRPAGTLRRKPQAPAHALEKQADLPAGRYVRRSLSGNAWLERRLTTPATSPRSSPRSPPICETGGPSSNSLLNSRKAVVASSAVMLAPANDSKRTAQLPHRCRTRSGPDQRFFLGVSRRSRPIPAQVLRKGPPAWSRELSLSDLRSVW